MIERGGGREKEDGERRGGRGSKGWRMEEGIKAYQKVIRLEKERGERGKGEGKKAGVGGRKANKGGFSNNFNNLQRQQVMAS